MQYTYYLNILYQNFQKKSNFYSTIAVILSAYVAQLVAALYESTSDAGTYIEPNDPVRVERDIGVEVNALIFDRVATNE